MTQRRASELDIAVMRKLRSQGATYLEISHITGFSEFTVLRHVGHQARKAARSFRTVRRSSPCSGCGSPTPTSCLGLTSSGLEAVRNATNKALRAEKAMRARA
jgi:hypothetical protein